VPAFWSLATVYATPAEIFDGIALPDEAAFATLDAHQGPLAKTLMWAHVGSEAVRSS
jgi:hypothetical protein